MGDLQQEYQLTLTSTDVHHTRMLGELCGRMVHQQTVINLRGRLGAGKTVFVSGLAKGLGIAEMTHSPTFTIVSEYAGGRLPLYHMDLYRLGESALRELDLFDEYFYGDGVCAVEWGDLIQTVLPTERLDVLFSDLLIEEEFVDSRRITLVAYGSEHVQVLREWMNLWPY
ncbi:tRNA (adenosine(37)-N6)-threonylcarbamoyltransferase complex ATPase subunit type 1 TsaE [Sulfoacidibacillus ferrooxidans]|uniref:tRNA threonylcarbamoyladenosine biosynthesis protein TsaE n=1 Tax=Sulfoacidibacillus ferrooxidans TaxID=2005001 RepID=A0A9X1VA50_9BACL|nr:tRNA (adenosine(37)-N6)-threonylcarbamoyltransferase complex ATPase subunit type 1 TsaE [Sulfoacidibacillus ferrooxidans]MCI0183709.1 tRNA threonylcarbamoyladenosine biosynthesis protein TsaE [Sulfoacidibacillus ferrooxidans]